MNNPEINSYVEKYINHRSEVTDQELKFLLIWSFVDHESPLFKSVLDEFRKRMISYEDLPECLWCRIIINPGEYFTGLCLNFNQIGLNLFYKKRINLSIDSIKHTILEVLNSENFNAFKWMISHMKIRKEWVLYLLDLNIFHGEACMVKKFNSEALKFIINVYFEFLPLDFIRKVFFDGPDRIGEEGFEILLENFNRGLLEDEYYQFDNQRAIENIISCLPSKHRSNFIELFKDRFPFLNNYGNWSGLLGEREVKGVEARPGTKYEQLFSLNGVPLLFNGNCIWRNKPLVEDL
jgi:hypothetical protein